MRYSKLPPNELDEAAKHAKTAVEHGQQFLKTIPRLPKSKALRKFQAQRLRSSTNLNDRRRSLKERRKRIRLAGLGKRVANAAAP